MEILHIPGFDNLTADWLSRCLEVDDTTDKEVERIAVPTEFILPVIPDKTTTIGFCPRVPSPDDFKVEYHTLEPEERRLLVEGASGLLFGPRHGKLFVPAGLRNEFIYWFHASPLGGHAGVNRTLRRMRLHVWWKGMAQDVAKFISNCLPCLRQKPPRRTGGTVGVLTRPSPMQLVSLDYVGPRPWGGRQVYYIVVIDHASRFIVGREADAPDSASAVKILKDIWVPVLGTPVVVLTDRGSSFTAKEFRQYVTDALGARLVFTSPYYPQGNAINESCHRGLELSIKAQELGTAGSLVHNSTPHPATGMSPYSFLFGVEPILPGWESLTFPVSEATRNARIRQRREMALMKEAIGREFKLEEREPERIEVGDWLIFVHSDYERALLNPTLANEKERHLSKYDPGWSLPAKVLKVEDKVLIVQEVGARNPRQVPRAQTVALKGPVPAELLRINMTHLDSYIPRQFARKRLKREGVATWDELITGVTNRDADQRLKREDVLSGGVPAPTRGPAKGQEVIDMTK